MAALLLAVVGTIAVLSWSGGSRVAVVPARSAVESEDDDAARGAGDASRVSDAGGDDAVTIAAERDASPPRAPPLEPLDPAAMRSLERRGRATFHGVVSRRDGTPVSDAQLWFNGAPVARSDADGAYRFEARHAVLEREQEEEGSLLAADHPDAGSVTVAAIGPSRRIDLALAGGNRLRGRAARASDGAPIAAAQVELLVYGDNYGNVDYACVECAFTRTARSDAEGRFEFAGLPRGGVVLRASAPGRDSRKAVWFLFEEQASLDVELLLKPTAQISGWFSPWPPRGAVAPRGDFEFHVSHRPSTNRSIQERHWSVDVAEDGTFSLDVPTDLPLQLELVCGESIGWADVATVPAGMHRFEFGRIDLVPLGTITGRLDAPADAIELLGGIHGEVTSCEARLDYARPIERDGRFTVGPFLMESATLVIGSTRSVVALYRDVTVEPGGVAELGIVAPTAACWCGEVRDAAGVPLAFASVSLGLRDAAGRWSYLSDGAGRWSEQSRCTTGEEGRYLVGETLISLEGQLQLRVTARGFAPHFFDLGAVAGCVITRRDVVLGGGGRVRGVVRDEAGLPVAGVSVSVDDVDDEEAHDVTGADGRFEIEGVADGEHELRFATFDRTEWTEAGVTSGGRDLELVRPDAGLGGDVYIGPTDTVPHDLDESDR